MKTKKTGNVPSEKEIQKAIIDYLAIRGLFFWRNNTGAMMSEYKGRTRFMRFGSVGSPDIFVLKNGHVHGLEVKGPKGKQSPSQKEWGESFERNGGHYHIVRSIDDVMQIFSTK